MKPKSTKIWVFLVIAPVAALMLTSVAQMIVRFTISSSDTGAGEIVVSIVNILSVIAGTLALVGMIGLPVWITMLIIALNHNAKLKKK